MTLQDRENDYNVWVSYMEIYNECINDLLAPGKGNLKIKDDPNVRLLEVSHTMSVAWRGRGSAE